MYSSVLEVFPVKSEANARLYKDALFLATDTAFEKYSTASAALAFIFNPSPEETSLLCAKCFSSSREIRPMSILALKLKGLIDKALL